MTQTQTEEARRYTGYYQKRTAAEDKELTRVGPGTSCGEYLRRFWQPVALAADLRDLPLRVRLLGEDLVLFRKPGGQAGLLHLHCVHRRASLEFGKIEDTGLRCCYHGWLYDVDGTILETPLEPENSPIRNNIRLGAYPVHEALGFVFAYLGPPDETPAFPVYDTFGIDWDATVACGHHFPCNWLQVIDNSLDHAHTVYLHSPPGGDEQFFDTWGRAPVTEYWTRDIGIYYHYSRRIGDNIWVGSEDILLPNFTQAGAVWSMDGKTPRYFGRGSFTRWIVPHDDTDTTVFMFAHFGDRSDPLKPEFLEPVALEQLEMGTARHRPYEEAQHNLGDAQAIASQGPIAIHRLEHLGHTDRGVTFYRRLLRRGKTPLQPAVACAAPIPTYAGDSVLRIPARPGQDDRELVREVSAKVLEVYRGADHLTGAARDAHIQAQVGELEAAYAR